jgi:hypothetical protein
MDVRLPDGTLLRGVPEGTTRAQLTEKLASSGYDVSKLTPPSEGLPVGRAAAVGAGALAPAAAGLGLGALGGLATGAALGPAALIGGAALGGAELVGQGENLVRSAFGYKPVKTPYEYVRGATQSLFPSTAPQNSQERALAAGIEGASTTLASAGGAGAAANAIRGGSRVLNMLAANPLAQTLAGGVGAAAPELAAQQGYTAPGEQLAASLVGGYAAGRAPTAVGRAARETVATVRNLFTPSAKQLEKSADAAFNTVKASGLDYEPSAVMDLRNRVQKDLQANYSPTTNPKVMDILDELTNKAQAGQTSIKDLHDTRKKINNELRIGYDPAQATQRKIGGIMIGALDDFITNPTTPTTLSKATGNTAQTAQTFQEAIDLYRKRSQSNEIERILERASYRKNVPGALATQFQKITTNPSRMAQFDPNQQSVIQALASGETSPGALNAIAGLAPGRSLAGMAEAAVTAAPAALYAFGQGIQPAAVGAAALGVGAAGAGMGARLGQHLLAQHAVNQLAASTRGGMLAAPTYAPNVSLAAPLFTQGVNAMLR